MSYIIRFLILWFLTASFLFTEAQESLKPLRQRFVVKTNLLSLVVAQRPTLSVEKAVSDKVSLEFSFVQGVFTKVLLTDHYAYSGLLLRAKKYFTTNEYGKAEPYWGAYLGNLNRRIITGSHTQVIGSNGYVGVGYGSRNFIGQAFRGGGSFGLSHVTKSRIVIDTQLSLGYGSYYKSNEHNATGHLDSQLWLSVGYCF
ncbi:MAG: hypothetical protein JWP69_1963 [Flaviaesturariibacter sp.]|nr:hypothetical protein [Flaviaesturariibacter sp.]